VRSQRILRWGGSRGGNGDLSSDDSSESDPDTQPVLVQSTGRKGADALASSGCSVRDSLSAAGPKEFFGTLRCRARPAPRLRSRYANEPLGAPRRREVRRRDSSRQSCRVLRNAVARTCLRPTRLLQLFGAAEAITEPPGAQRWRALPKQIRVFSETLHSDGIRSQERQPSGCLAGGAVRAIGLLGGRTAVRFAEPAGEDGSRPLRRVLADFGPEAPVHSLLCRWGGLQRAMSSLSQVVCCGLRPATGPDRAGSSEPIQPGNSHRAADARVPASASLRRQVSASQ